jgi:hypothetical protein
MLAAPATRAPWVIHSPSAHAAVGVDLRAVGARGHDPRRQDPAEHLHALVGPVAHAEEALAALRRAGHDDAIADAHAPRRRARRLDDAGRRVPEDGRGRRGNVAARTERIGDADVDGAHPDDDLVGAGLAQLDLLDHERLPDRLEDCSPRGHTV